MHADTWNSIRIKAAMVGWRQIIRNEANEHLKALSSFDDTRHYQSLHIFFSSVASPIERSAMLEAGYQPPN